MPKIMAAATADELFGRVSDKDENMVESANSDDISEIQSLQFHLDLLVR